MCSIRKWGSLRLFPAAVYSGRPLAHRLTFLLVAIHVAIGTLWSLTLILTSRSAARLLKTPLFIRWMDRATGGLFMLFAAKLAFSHR